jgi:hypothetical protein
VLVKSAAAVCHPGGGGGQDVVVVKFLAGRDDNMAGVKKSPSVGCCSIVMFCSVLLSTWTWQVQVQDCLPELAVCLAAQSSACAGWLSLKPTEGWYLRASVVACCAPCGLTCPPPSVRKWLWACLFLWD